METNRVNMDININPSDYKILVVDDVMSNVLLLKILLKNEKYHIATAMNGDEALEAVRRESPDLILLDVMMPDINGFDLAAKLKTNPKYKDIPIIFLTALNSTADIVKGFHMGADDFISKPFNKEELTIRISHQLSLITAKRIIKQQTEELKNTMVSMDRLHSVIEHELHPPIESIKINLNKLALSLDGQIEGEMQDTLNLANKTTEEVFSLLDNLLKKTKSQIG